MNNARNITIPEMKGLLKATSLLSFSATNTAEAYQWIEQLLRSTNYRHIRKKDKSTVRQYIVAMTGYSKSQLDRLIGVFCATGRIRLKEYRRNRFNRKYTDHDIVILARVDDAHGRLSGPATKKILKDEFEIFSQIEYQCLASISSAHIYNLREKQLYRTYSTTYTKTQAVQRSIGERRKPRPDGKPGYLRIDSVHAGDSNDGEKGVYYINLVDEVTQWEFVICVERITERYMRPALQTALALLPFVVHNIHADNGSEYINHWVALLLEKIRSGLTKSRSRQSNDNALVESKNGSIIRKQFGYIYIPSHHAPLIHQWCLAYLNPYLNYHRPCGFSKEVIVTKYGKIKKRYPQEDYATPYEKLKSLPYAQYYLKQGITFEQLDTRAYAESHTAFATRMNNAKQTLFKKINL